MKPYALFVSLLSYGCGLSSLCAEDAVFFQDGIYQVTVLTDWNIEQHAASREVGERLWIALQPVIGFNDEPSKDERQRQGEAIRRHLESSEESIETRNRSYGTLYRIALNGTVSRSAIAGMQKEIRREAMLLHWKQTCTGCVIIGGTLLSMLAGAKLDRITNGDRRGVVCLISLIASACVIVLVLAICW